MCGWKNQYEEMIEQYCSENHVDHFLWQDQYNFDRIESNFETFERELLEGSFAKNKETKMVKEEEEEEEYDDEDVDSVDNGSDAVSLLSLLKQAGVHHVEEDDGRDLPVYCDDKSKLERASEFFISQILTRRIKNSFKDDVENGVERIVLPFNGVLITLNHVNSRCFKEILKWDEVAVPEEECFYFCFL